MKREDVDKMLELVSDEHLAGALQPPRSPEMGYPGRLPGPLRGPGCSGSAAAAPHGGRLFRNGRQ